MNIYVSGGSKCGKSEIAENMARKMAQDENLPLYYVATMVPKDGEDQERIKKHRETRKDKGFETLEWKTPEDFSSLGKQFSGQGNACNGQCQLPGVFLVDSVTALLENTIFDENYNVDQKAWKKVTSHLVNFMNLSDKVVFVSDFVYSDGIEYDQVTETYRKNLAMCDRTLAEKCDQVWEVSCGCPIQWK